MSTGDDMEDEINSHLRTIAFLEKRVDYLEKVSMLQEDKIDQLTSELEMERAKLANCTCQDQDQDGSDSDESEESESESIVYEISKVEEIQDGENDVQNDDFLEARTDVNVNFDEFINENPLVHMEEEHESSSESVIFPKSLENEKDQQSSSTSNGIKRIVTVTDKFQHIANNFKKAKMMNNRKFKNDKINEPNDLKSTTDTPDTDNHGQEPLLYMPEFDEKIIIDDDDDEVEFISEVRPGHIMSEDISQISYECSYCSLTFTDISDLTDHKRTHIVKKPFKCPTCSETFLQIDHLQIHIRLHHTGGKPYLCSLCPKKFSELLDFKRHQALHSGKLPFECQICKHKYPIKEDLDHHTKVDNCQARALQHQLSLVKPNYNKGLEKSNICKFCSKSFSHVSLMEIHERIHTGIKPYKCHICPKTFNQDERPFKCHVCQKSFNQLGNLKSHSKTHHPAE